MAKYLDGAGLDHTWSKIKTYLDNNNFDLNLSKYAKFNYNTQSSELLIASNDNGIAKNVKLKYFNKTVTSGLGSSFDDNNGVIDISFNIADEDVITTCIGNEEISLFESLSINVSYKYPNNDNINSEIYLPHIGTIANSPKYELATTAASSVVASKTLELKSFHSSFFFAIFAYVTLVRSSSDITFVGINSYTYRKISLQ